MSKRNENYSEYIASDADIVCLCPRPGGGICMIFCFLPGVSHVTYAHVSLVYGSVIACFFKGDEVPFYLGGIETDSPVKCESELRVTFVNRAAPVVAIFPGLTDVGLEESDAHVTAKE